MRLALIILLFISASFAAITAMNLSGSLDQSGTARIDAAAGFSAPGGKTVCLNISGMPDSVIVRDRSGLIIQHELRQEGNSSLICATVPVDYLEFSITSSSMTAKEGSIWDFDLSLGASENISAFNATLTLPPGATLKGTNGAVQSGGDSLIISWSAANIDTLHRARMRASYELVPAGDGGPDYSLMAIAGIAVLLAVAAFGMLRRPEPRQAKPSARTPGHSAEARAGQTAAPPVQTEAPVLESNPVFRTLDETDKEIIREMRRQGGKTTQAHIYLHTHVPKATLSRRLASLANKGLIVKSQKGNRNLVSLTDVLGK